MKRSERISTERKARSCQREALRRREDPTIYQVKQKLKRHPDPSYSSMSEEDLTKEAIHLTDPEFLKEFFSDITTHDSMKEILKEASASYEQGETDTDRLIDSRQNSECQASQQIQKRREKAGQLTLKLHLSHSNETPSILARLGAALVKIPYGVLHAYLEIGDTHNPEVTYIVEFNNASLVQPRRKKSIEPSALEATIPFGGCNLKTVKHTAATSPISQLPQVRTGATGHSIAHDLSYVCQVTYNTRKEIQQGEDPSTTANQGNIRAATSLDDPSLPRQRPRSVRVQSSGMTPPARKKTPCPAPPLVSNQQEHDSVKTVARESPPKLETVTANKVTSTEEGNGITPHAPPLQEFQKSANEKTSREDLTEYLQLSLSKMLLLDKLVSIIVQYNKKHYYHSITRNCQTFVVDVLQSFGVWENFKFGDKLEQYLENLNKGRKEVYKSHKSINDRVKYLVVSGEINDITYDEARYLRSLYTIFHLEEASRMTASPVVCTDHECLLKELEKRINEIRPEGAMTLKTPEHYM